jgi:hypothetical protein
MISTIKISNNLNFLVFFKINFVDKNLPFLKENLATLFQNAPLKAQKMKSEMEEAVNIMTQVPFDWGAKAEFTQSSTALCAVMSDQTEKGEKSALWLTIRDQPHISGIQPTAFKWLKTMDPRYKGLINCAILLKLPLQFKCRGYVCNMA